MVLAVTMMVAMDLMGAGLDFHLRILPGWIFSYHVTQEVRSKAYEDVEILPKVSPHFLGLRMQPL
jgi:hypothetical protein